MNRTGWKRQLTGVLSFLGGGSSTLLLSSLGVVLMVCVSRSLGLWEGIELETLDLFLRHRPLEAPDERITILEITENDLQELGTYPVPDKTMVELLEKLENYEPRVIGLDIFRDLPVINPVEGDLERSKNAHRELKALLQRSAEQDATDIVVIEKILGTQISAPEGISDDNIGFADALLDKDGFFRRSLLASRSTADPDNHRLSFTIQMAQKYLAAEGIDLDNGLKDPIAMRFGQTELFRITANSGGYHDQDTGNNATLLVNFRHHQAPFQRISLSEFRANEFSEEWVRDRIILIGMTAESANDYVNSAAVIHTNPSLVQGVEFQAHAISQIINAVLEGRPIIKTWSHYWEYFWIVGSGIAGLSLIYLKRSISTTAVVFIISTCIPLVFAYGLLLVGFWIPAIPAWLSYFINGSGVLLYRIYDYEKYEQGRKIRFDERQRVLESSYNAIHNGPLQTLKSLIRKVSSQQQPVKNNGAYSAASINFRSVTADLHQIDKELRNIYEFMQREYLQREYSAEQSQIYLTPNHVIELNAPFHELLYQVYLNKLQESEDYFQGIKVKISDFCPMNEDYISIAHKEETLRFFEEALCNVEQHALDVTRLEVTCKQEGTQNVIRVSDNGSRTEMIALASGRAESVDVLAERAARVQEIIRQGDGSKQAKRLAKRLRGQFSRRTKFPKGTVCELIWPVKPTAM